eukprot:GCRY01003023.1.p1 GENE.GCRY01003023.1~~GCRY01003023.1.p1  ORF type:complete len:451 (+),score=101.81 GCRY01003023.1:52-1404(+)
MIPKNFLFFLFALLLVFSSTLSQVHVEEEEDDENTSSCVILTDDNFEDNIENGVWFIKFYAPWCGHCRRLAPIWEDLAHEMVENPDVHVGKIDCTENKLCRTYDVRGFPTLKLFKSGEFMSDYKGERSFSSLKKYLNRKLEPSLQVVTAEELQSSVKKNALSFVLFDGTSLETDSLDRIGHQFSECAQFFVVDNASPSFLLSAYGITSTPAFLAVSDGAKRVLEYDGDFTKNDMEQFVSAHRYPALIELDGSNFYDVTHTLDKPTLIAVVPKKQQGSNKVMNAMRSVALEGETDYQFAYIDADVYGTHLKRFGYDPKTTTGWLLLLDAPRMVHYPQPHGHEGPASPAAIRRFIADCEIGVIPPAGQGSSWWGWLKVKGSFVLEALMGFANDSPILFILVGICVCLPIMTMCMGFPDDEVPARATPAVEEKPNTEEKDTVDSGSSDEKKER